MTLIGYCAIINSGNNLPKYKTDSLGIKQNKYTPLLQLRRLQYLLALYISKE